MSPTEVPSGAEVVLQSGPAVDAILASAALPAVFPPVTIDGRVLIDGGVVNNTPITTAIELGATEIPPPCPVDVSPIDFSETAELIERAATGTRQWLAAGQPDSMHLLAPHVHARAVN